MFYNRLIFLQRKAVRRTFQSKNAIALIYYTVVLSIIPVIIHNVVDVPEQPSQRFYLWATPTFLLLLALAIVSLSARRKVIIGTILFTGFSAFSIWGVLFYHPLDFKTPLTFVSSKYQSKDLLFYSPAYEIAFMASGHYYPESLKMGGLFLLPKDDHSGEYYFLPSNNEIYALMTNNYKIIDEKYLTDHNGEHLKKRTEESLKDADRVWVVVYRDGDQESCVGCDVLDSVFAMAWQEETWYFDSFNVHLYTRVAA